MGVKVKRSGKDVATSLYKRGARSTRQLRRVHAQAAQKLAEVVRAMTPCKEGVLEGGVEIVESRDGRRKVFSVIVKSENVPYAIYMHEKHYDLGPGSEAKDRSGEHRVGRKFVTRGRAWIVNEWDFYGKMKHATREGLK